MWAGLRARRVNLALLCQAHGLEGGQADDALSGDALSDLLGNLRHSFGWKMLAENVGRKCWHVSGFSFSRLWLWRLEKDRVSVSNLMRSGERTMFLFLQGLLSTLDKAQQRVVLDVVKKQGLGVVQPKGLVSFLETEIFIYLQVSP